MSRVGHKVSRVGLVCFTLPSNINISVRKSIHINIMFICYFYLWISILNLLTKAEIVKFEETSAVGYFRRWYFLYFFRCITNGIRWLGPFVMSTTCLYHYRHLNVIRTMNLYNFLGIFCCHNLQVPSHLSQYQILMWPFPTLNLHIFSLTKHFLSYIYFPPYFSLL